MHYQFFLLLPQAEKYFADMRLQEPYYFEGMEIYSTALWHLQKEVELSSLAQELSDLDKNSPQVSTALPSSSELCIQ
jgi:hypothetical protein